MEINRRTAIRSRGYGLYPFKNKFTLEADSSSYSNAHRNKEINILKNNNAYEKNLRNYSKILSTSRKANKGINRIKIQSALANNQDVFKAEKQLFLLRMQNKRGKCI